ncbi:hypothetical protein AXF42_Ash008434 [Apostasia shenzhenica]|uniref:Outer envelope membrane protein 7 n=1 Tax=Apostasia shenzhenica TaxID=1088818 RepID=A0A2I0AXX0_9ASPA|nr:hypothetical protein AXF42_Ash008434 [Apostasia shenzhenica]
MGGREREGGAMKSALVVAGGLVLAWITMETTFKPWLDRLRSAITRSNPAADPDDDGITASAADDPKAEEEENESNEELIADQVKKGI